MRSVRTAVALLYLLGFVFVTTAADTEEDVPDYSSGLKQLAAAGLPELAEANYVSVLRMGAGPGRETVLSWLRTISSSQPFGAGLSLPYGQVFLLSVSEDGSAEVFDPATLARLRLAPPSLPEGMDENQARAMREAMDPQDWPSASLSQLGRQVERQLRKQSEGASDFQDPFQSAGAAKALLSAAILQAKGKTARANRIAHLAFKLAPDRKTLLKSALNDIATGQYLAIIAGFRQEGDWAAFQGDLSALIERRSATWEAVDAAREVLKTLANRPENADVLPGEGFNEAQRQAAAKLLTADLGRLQGASRSLAGWPLLPPNSFANRSADDPLLQFLGMRGAAIEVLLAWLDDDTLTPFIGVDRSDMNDLFSGMSMVEGGDPAQAMAVYQQARRKAAKALLPRPQPRSSIAKALLKPAIAFPGNSGRNDSLSPDLAQEEAARLLDMTPLEMARYYLRDGGRQQQRVALRYLAYKGSEKDMATVEDLISTSTQAYEAVQLLGSYVRARGPAAAPFFERIAQSLLDEEGSRDYLKKQIDALRPLVSPEQDEAADKEKNVSFAEALQHYSETMAADTPESPRERTQVEPIRKAMMELDSMDERIQAVNGILEAIQQGQNPRQKVALARMLYSLPQLKRVHRRMREQNNVSRELLTWEKLLAGDGPGQSRRDEVSMTDSQWDSAAALEAIREREDQWLAVLGAEQSEARLQPGQGDSATIAAYALFQMTRPAGNQHMFGNPGMQVLRLLPDGGREWMLNSARRLVKGEIDALPSPPDPGSLSREDRQKLLDRLGRLDTGDLSRELAALKPAAYLALREEIPATTNEKLRGNLHALFYSVQETHCPPDSVPLTGLCKEMSGKRLTADSVRQLQQAILTQATEGRAFTVVIRLALQGGQLHISNAARLMGPLGIGSGAEARLNGMIQAANGRNAFANWPVSQDKSRATEQGPDSDLDAVIQRQRQSRGNEYQQEEFWEVLAEILDPAGEEPITQRGPISISVSAYLPAEKQDEADKNNPER